MPAFTKATKDLDELIDNVMTLHHPDLSREDVTVSALEAWPKRELLVHGYPALAYIRINSVKERVQGMADATIVVNGYAWKDLKTDSHGRPKLKMRRHDWELCGFSAVAERHGGDALEVVHVREVMGKYRQLLMDWGDDRKGPTAAQTEKAAKDAAKSIKLADVREKKEFAVCSPRAKGNAVYRVLAYSLEDAVRLNAEQHPGDADCTIREPKAKEKLPTLCFDLTEEPKAAAEPVTQKGTKSKPKRKGNVTELYAERA